MTELIYLSHRKLLQFPPTRFAPRGGSLSVDLTLPLAHIAVKNNSDDKPTDTKRLKKVLADVESRAVQYTDPSVAAGDWIFFEVPMNHAVLNESYLAPALLFLDCEVGHDHRPRLLLHGSSEHLVGGEAKAPNPDGSVTTDSMGGAASQASFLYRFAHRLHVLAAESPAGNAGVYVQRALMSGSQGPEPVDALAVTADRSLGQAVQTAVELLDQGFDSATAARLVGYARVTGRFAQDPPIVTASPLFVGYSRRRAEAG